MAPPGSTPSRLTMPRPSVGPSIALRLNSRSGPELFVAKPSRPRAQTLRMPRPKELATILDHVRYAVTQFRAAQLVFAHGTTDPLAEAAFMVCEALHLPPDRFDAFAGARVTHDEQTTIFDLIEARIRTRKPAAYLMHKAYLRGIAFYVDERTIVPRSYLGEIL